MKVQFTPEPPVEKDPKWEKQRGGMEVLNERTYDCSCMSCFGECRYKFYLKYILQLEPKKFNSAPTWGFMMHEALAKWYDKDPLIGGNLDIALAEWLRYPDPCSDPNRTRGRGESRLKEYVKRYPTETFTIRQGPEIEFHLSMSNGTLFSGRMDMIVEERGLVYVFDHKTEQKASASKERPHLQFDGYSYACRELVGRCDGVIKNCISTADKPRQVFHRDPCPRTEYELDSFEEMYIQYVEDIERAVEGKRFPKDRGNCNTYYSDCQFADICIYGEDERTIELNYKRRGSDE